MPAAGEVAALKLPQNDTMFPQSHARAPVRQVDTLSRTTRVHIRSRLNLGAIRCAPGLLRTTDEKEEKKRDARERERRGKGDKALFKRVLTPRQGPSGHHGGEEEHRAPRITAPRVSCNPGLYAAVGRARWSPRILGLAALLHLPQSRAIPAASPSSSEADARTTCVLGTHAGALSSGPPRNEFQQVETRAGGLRPRRARVLCAGTSRGEKSPTSPPPLRLPRRSEPTARGLIVSARSAVIRHAGC